jgi:hypothetical protein
MKSVIYLLLFLNISIFLIKKYKNEPVLVFSNRTEEQINYEKCLLIRNYYKNRLEKLEEVKNLVSNKDYLEIQMLYGVSEYDLEISELKINKN